MSTLIVSDVVILLVLGLSYLGGLTALWLLAAGPLTAIGSVISRHLLLENREEVMP